MCTSQTSQLISVLFIYLKLEVYLLEKNLWQFLIKLSFVSELSRFRAILFLCIADAEPRVDQIQISNLSQRQ